MRYREIRTSDLDRARAAVAAWRADHPEGTPDQLIEALGPQFHPDFAVVLRGTLVAVDRHRARAVTGIITGPAREGR